MRKSDYVHFWSLLPWSYLIPSKSSLNPKHWSTLWFILQIVNSSQNSRHDIMNIHIYIYVFIVTWKRFFFCDVVGISSVLSLITLPLNMSFNNTTLRLALSHENSPQKADQTETQTPIGVVKVVSTPIMWLFPRIDRRITRSLCNAIQFVICFLEIRNVNIARLQHIVHGIEATVPKENIPWP